jgi:hypothetical protein
MYIILRDYIKDMSYYAELRGFIKDNQLTALTQYQEDLFYSFLKDNYEYIKTYVVGYYEERVKIQFIDTGLNHAIVDFGLIIKDGKIHDIYVIEFNPFSMRTGSGCLDWAKEKNYITLLNGPFEFRIIN